MSVTKAAVITGASSGIGRALARQLVAEYELFLCGRNATTLKETAKHFDSTIHKWHLIELDLTSKASINAAIKTITDKINKLDLLVNNAGLSQRSLAYDTIEQVEQLLFQVNYFGPIELTKKLLPALRKAKQGKIAVTSSIVGKFGYPLRSSYSAAKHALHGYFESLRFEEKKYGIKVQLFVIGRVQTNVSLNAIIGNGTNYGKMDKGQARGITSKLCAKKIVLALGNSQKEILIGGAEKWMVLFKKFLPFLFYRIAEKETKHL